MGPPGNICPGSREFSRRPCLPFQWTISIQYLRSGTGVGMRDVKAGRIYDVSDPENQRKLPQHDFSNPQVHVTSSSFRFMAGHQEIIEGSHPVNDVDQTVVTVRPKHHI